MLDQRVRVPELMDQPGLDPAEHRRALAGLRRVNAVSRTAARLWPRIARLCRERPGMPLRVLDLASGGGDVTLALARRAAASGLPVQVEGCDLSAVAVEHAASRAAEAGLRGVRFFQLDVLKDPLPDEYDVLTCSLFLHHLADEDAGRLMGEMAASARQMVLVDDLRRSRAGYLLAWLGTRVLSRSPIVHVDGPLSVRAAFTDRELLNLAERNGLHGASVTRHWPQRFLLEWKRPPPNRRAAHTRDPGPESGTSS